MRREKGMTEKHADGFKADEGTDALLALLVAALNDGDSVREIPITLSLGGHLISGQMVGLGTYRDALRDQWGRAPGDGGALFADMLSELLDGPTQEVPAYIHLVEAKLTWCGGTATFGPWRGKMSAVDGWSFGTSERVS